MRAIQISSMPGGDGTSMTLDIDSDAITDLANNTNLELKISLFSKRQIDRSDSNTGRDKLYTGVLLITGSETIDAIPSSLVNLSKLEIKENKTMPSLYA